MIMEKKDSRLFKVDRLHWVPSWRRIAWGQMDFACYLSLIGIFIALATRWNVIRTLPKHQTNELGHIFFLLAMQNRFLFQHMCVLLYNCQFSSWASWRQRFDPESSDTSWHGSLSLHCIQWNPVTRFQKNNGPCTLWVWKPQLHLWKRGNGWEFLQFILWSRFMIKLWPRHLDHRWSCRAQLRLLLNPSISG